MPKALGVLLGLAVFLGVGGTVLGQPSAGEQKSPPLQGNPNDQSPHSKAPTNAQALAECVIREQADHTGMPKSEAETACRQRLATKGQQRRSQTRK